MTPRGDMLHRQHVAVIAIGGDHLVAFDQRHLHAGDDGFLADVEVAEAADEAHAVELAGLLLEAADQQHVAIGRELLFLGEFAGFGADRPDWGFRVRFRFRGRLLGGVRPFIAPCYLSLAGHCEDCCSPYILARRLACESALRPCGKMHG